MPNIELADHQLKALDKLKHGKILCGVPGSGKSRVALAYFYLKVGNGKLRINGEGDMHPMQTPTPLYIITTAKKRDNLEWDKELADFAMSRDFDSPANPPSITVDSWNNIGKYEGVRRAFFIFDEQRLVGRGAWVRSYLKIAKSNWWILLSGTPGDTWSDFIPVFIANGFYKNRSDFSNRHIVFSRFTKFPKVERYVDTGILERHRRAILVDMPYERHTRRHLELARLDYDRERWNQISKKRWNVYTDSPIKDVAEFYRCARRVVNEDVSRLGELMVLLEKHPRIIVFYNFNFELEALRVLANSLNYPVAEWNGHKHEEIPDEDRWLYLVQYTAGAEGWNCTSTDAMVFFSLTYSYKLFEQAQGRIDRLNTPYRDLYYYIFMSNTSVDRRIWACLRSKKNFQERKNADLWPDAHLST